LVKFQQIYSIM